MKRVFVWIAAIVLTGLIALRMAQYRSRDENLQDKVQQSPLLVTVGTAVRGHITEELLVYGDVHGVLEVEIFPSVPGKFYKELKRKGDRVQQNEVIALIDRDEPGMKFSHAEVKSPIAGDVIRLYAEKGDTVNPARAVAMVAQMDRLKVKCYITEEEFGRIRLGQKAYVKVGAYPDSRFAGAVSRISPAFDPITRKMDIEVLLDNRDYLLRPGMFAEVWIVVAGRDDVLVVPRKAVFTENGIHSVCTVSDEGRVAVKEVSVGMITRDKAEIVSGLEEYEIVVIEGNYGLTDGSTVREAGK